MGCASSRPAVPPSPAPIRATSTSVPSSNLLTLTPRGFALSYLKNLPDQNRLVVEALGPDHDSLMTRLSQVPATAHLVAAQADVYVSCDAENITLASLGQALSECLTPETFIWLDVCARNDLHRRTGEYVGMVEELVVGVNRAVVVTQGFNERGDINPWRALEMFFIKSKGGFIVVCPKREREEFCREITERPVGFARFKDAVEHSIDVSVMSCAVNERLKENFGKVKTCAKYMFATALSKMADDEVARSRSCAEDLAFCLCARASLHYICEEREESQKKFQLALAHMVKSHQRGAPIISSILHNIATIHLELNQFDQAANLFNECIAMDRPSRSSSLKRKSPSNAQIIALMNEAAATDLAAAYNPQIDSPDNASFVSSNSNNTPTSSLQKGKSFSTEWRDSFVIPLPRDDGIADTLNNLACLLAKNGPEASATDLGRAELLLKESLTLRRGARDSETLEIATSMLTLAIVYEYMGNIQSAREEYESALAMQRKLNASGDALKVTLDSYGCFLWEMFGDFDISKPLLEESLALRVSCSGEESEDVADGLISLARFFASANDAEKSSQLATQAVDLLLRLSGDDAGNALVLEKKRLALNKFIV